MPSVSKIRSTAIIETAATLGAQSGLAWRAKQINQMLLKHQEALSNVFNFRQLLLKHNDSSHFRHSRKHR